MKGFFAMLSRMKYINRWGLMRAARTETLSEHTLDVAVLTHALIEIGNTQFGNKLDAGKGVLLALYHDSAEILTGDMPTPVKYHDSTVHDAYKTLETQSLSRLLCMLPDELKPKFERYVKPDDWAKEYIPYIKAADKLSALIKCIEEKKSGNCDFDRAFEATLNHSSLKIPEAQVFINEYLPAYYLTLDDIEKFD